MKKGHARFAVDFGSGTMIPIGENSMLVFDVSEGGTFWLLSFTVGLDYAF